MAKRGLGKGLDALLPVEDDGPVRVLRVEEIELRREQPRKRFDEAAMAELVSSVREHGVLQPLLVRRIADGYELVAGERRLRAAREAGIEEVPVVIREMDEREAAEIALIENLQREDLSPVEEARAFRQMMDEFGYTQDSLAGRLGKSRPYVANAVRLLALPDEVLEFLDDGRLSAGHARALMATGLSGEELVRAAQRVVDKGLTVRDVEQMGKKRKSTVPVKPAEYVLLEERLQEALGTRAVIHRGRRGGKIEISFYSDADLERLMELLEIEL